MCIIRKKSCFLLAFMFSLLFSITVCAKEYNMNFATTTTCVLVDQQTVSFSAVFPEVPMGDDGMLYLYELAPYEYDIAPNKEPIAVTGASKNPAFTFPINHRTAGTKLYSKFVVAVHKGGAKIALCNPQYIVNPEILATHTKPRTAIPFVTTQSESFTNLHIKDRYDSDYYVDRVVQIMTREVNSAVTNPKVLLPDSHPVDHQGYYMLNASNEAGVRTLANVISQYAASSCGEDWIIGNEVNNRKWNYMAWIDWDTYMQEYEQAFRVAYNAIKSENANARVYICLEQDWDRNRPQSHQEYFEYIDAKKFIQKFNEDISRSGNIDWGVSEHPYTVPLTYVKFWDMSGCPDGAYMERMIKSNQMLSFQNLSVLTDYMRKPELLNPQGQVRHIILSELGITSHQGDDVQAAALFASYYAAKSNPYIEQIIYLTDSPSYGFNLSNKAYEVYQNLGGSNESAYDEWAKAVIGISSWSDVLR